jgi:hypothetical protein
VKYFSSTWVFIDPVGEIQYFSMQYDMYLFGLFGLILLGDRIRSHSHLADKMNNLTAQGAQGGGGMAPGYPKIISEEPFVVQRVTIELIAKLQRVYACSKDWIVGLGWTRVLLFFAACLLLLCVSVLLFSLFMDCSIKLK